MKRLFKNWYDIMITGNMRPGERIDLLSRWLLATRACVFSMSATSVLVGALLAAGDGKVNISYTLLALLGTVLAHASNNLINDLFDFMQGVDTDGYPRTLYAPHPLISRLISLWQLLGAFMIFSFIELCIAVFFAWKVGLPVFSFAIAGFLLSVFYVAPPFKLKRNGLGEPAIFLIWGPLITVGTFYVITGSAPLHAWLASVPYGIVVTNVLVGKHLDKYKEDKEKGIRTLPVLLGYLNCRRFAVINMIVFYLCIAVLVAVRILHPLTLIALLSLPRFFTVRKIFLRERPAERPDMMEFFNGRKPRNTPEEFPVWPLWYVVWAFWFNKLAGGLFIVGMIAGVAAHYAGWL